MELIINSNGLSSDELIAAQKLKSIFENYFISNPCDGEMYFCNYQLPANYAERDIDILVLFKINQGSKISVQINGSTVNMIGGFIFNFEVKSHSQFIFKGNEIITQYKSSPDKNATKQALNVKNNTLNYLKSHFDNNVPRIYDFVYLHNCDSATTIAIIQDQKLIPSNYFDSSFTADIFFKSLVHTDRKRNEFGNTNDVKNITEIKEFITSIKSLPKYYSNKLDLLAVNSFENEKKELFSDENNFYSINGSPGAGKTILMLSKCLDLLKQNKSCLYLTFNKQLVFDLKRLQENLKSSNSKNPLLNLKIETWDSYVTRLYSFHKHFTPLGSPQSNTEQKIKTLLSRYNGNAKMLLINDEDINSNNIYRYGKVEYVFIDEAQDLPLEIFQVLSLFYKNNICLAVGKQQEFNINNLPQNSNVITLNKIYRQKENPSEIVKRFLECTLIDHSYKIQSPIPLELVGGKSIVYTGHINEAFYVSILNYLKEYSFSNIDFLHLHNNSGDLPADTNLPHYFGGDAEQALNLNLNNFRYYHYNSCRGLEGTIILYENFDLYYNWCVNMFGEDQAKKRIFIALTRVKDISIFTFSDLNHWLFTDVISNHSKIKREVFPL